MVYCTFFFFSLFDLECTKRQHEPAVDCNVNTVCQYVNSQNLAEHEGEQIPLRLAPQVTSGSIIDHRVSA
jgi:hypothetical protein